MTLNKQKSNNINLKEDLEIYRINEEQAEYDNANDTINSYQGKKGYATKDRKEASNSSALREYGDSITNQSKAA